MADFAPYAAMFWAALLAATFFPGASEILLATFLASSTGDALTMLVAATTGNTLGSVVNYGCGRFLAHHRDRRWFPFSSGQLERWPGFFRQYGLPSLLFAWVPIVGDVLTVAAGMMRVPILPFVLLVAAGKFGRYLALSAGVWAWPSD